MLRVTTERGDPMKIAEDIADRLHRRGPEAA
jgi:hypothetical protein